MNDCSVVLTAKGNKVSVHGKASMRDLLTLCGSFQVIIGRKAIKDGTDLDTVKDWLLDICLESIQRLEQQENE